MRHLVLFSAFSLACDTAASVDEPAGKDPKDSGDTGDALPVDSSKGTYAGTIEGLNTYNGVETTCTGNATATIKGEGVLNGYLVCTFTSGFAQEGVWAGTEADGVVDSLWTDDYGNGYIIDFPGAGTYENGNLVVDFDWADESIGVTFVGTATLTRQ